MEEMKIFENEEFGTIRTIKLILSEKMWLKHWAIQMRLGH